MNKIYVVRHGETDWNKNGICQGKTNISLNENGIAQAKVLKDKINVNLIDICYVSPLNRTIETAKIITNNKLDLIIDDRIVERGFGTLEGKPFNYTLDNIPRTQDLQPIYEETSGFYIYTHDVMTELHRRIGENPFIVEIGEIESIDIDEAEDFIIADAVYNHIFKKDVK